jgi:methylglutaconyl-CoA hydratase
MSYEFLTTRRDGPVDYVTLNRPEVRNAFNEQLIAELTAWAAAVTADETVRCAVMAGAGPAFCAGADLAWMSKMVTYSHDDNVADASAAAHMYTLLDHLPVPLIGRIHGAALGGGAGLAAVCDIAVAGQAAVFGFTEVKLGIVPAIISPYVLAKIGSSLTRELFLTGVRFSAQRALGMCLVHAVVPEADLDARIAQYVGDVLSAGPEAVTTAKSLIREIARRPPGDVVGITAEAIATRRVSDEGQEGMSAFLTKRRATWNVSPDPDRQSR